MNILVVGAGFAGATVARELAEAGHLVTVIDKRDHVAGNAFDYTNEHGIRVHAYGPHLFHTNNKRIGTTSVDLLSGSPTFTKSRHCWLTAAM